MTHRLSPATLQFVVGQFIDALGAKECARLTGKAEFTIYKARNPLGGYMIPHEDFVLLDAAVAKQRGEVEATPYQEWVRRRVRLLAGVEQAAGRNVVVEALDVGAAAGNVLALVREVTDETGAAGRRLSGSEREAVKAKLAELNRQVSELEAALGAGEAP